MTRQSKTFVTAFVVIVLAAFGVFAWLSHESRKTDDSSPTTSSTSSSSSTTPSKRQRVLGVTPLLDAFPNAPKVKDASTTVYVDDRKAQSSQGFALSYSKNFVVPFTTDRCTLTKADEFCLVARDGSKKPQFNVIFLKDAAHSRLFENPENFKKATVEGAATAGSLSIETGGRKNQGLVIVAKDSSGWLVIARNGDLDIKKLSKEFEVTKPGNELTN